jgi:hypothetical protein
MTRSQFRSSLSSSRAVSEDEESLEEDDTFDFLKSKKGVKGDPKGKKQVVGPQYSRTNAVPSMNTSLEQAALKSNQNVLNTSAGNARGILN